VEFAYYFHYCKNLKFEDRPDYSTLKSLFFDLLMQDHTITTEFTFDWFLEPEEEKEMRDLIKPQNLNATNEDNNLIDLTPMDASDSHRKSIDKSKKDYSQFNNTRTAEFNNLSPTKSNNEPKSSSHSPSAKNHTKSFSESGSSDSSEMDDTLRMKGEEEVKKSI
jgi:hypothetical protein